MNVAVVGAGVSGLSAAVRLLEAGQRVTVLAATRTPETTSDRSAAAFTPFRAPGSERMRRWTRDSYAAFVELASRGDASAGVRVIPMTEWFFQPLDGDPWWFDLVAGAERMTRVPERYADGIRARMPTMDMTKYMRWLEARVLALGGRFETRTVRDLREPFEHGHDVVVDASGLGARELCRDPRVRPMRGQVIHAPNDIGLDECYVDSGRGSDATYVFPFERHVVLGGTYERDQESAVTDELALARIVERCRTLLREMGHSRWDELARTRIKAWAGLRPARVEGEDETAIRLETELLDGRWPVVHDYGHGRIGVTVSWGCADDVVRAVASL